MPHVNIPSSVPTPVTNGSSQPPGPGLFDLTKLLLEQGKALKEIAGSFWEESRKSKEAENRFKLKMTVIAGGIIVFVVVVAGFMTYKGKLDGSTFGFLLGLVTGYTLTFIRDSIRPPKEE